MLSKHNNMSQFKRYQAKQYIQYLKNHEGTLQDMYTLIQEGPYSIHALAKEMGIPYHTFRRNFVNKSLSLEQLVKLLETVFG